MTVLRFGTYNVLEYRKRRRLDGEEQRWERVAEVIRQMAADVWAVQEVAHETALHKLAEATGLCCVVPPRYWDEDGEVACDPGGNGFGVGLLWRPGIEPVPRTLRIYQRDVFFHGLVQVVLDVGGTLVQVASTHLTPFGRHHRVDEAERLVSALTRPDDRRPGVVGSDSNAISGDRVRGEDGAWRYHVPDPYAKQDWYDALIHQCHWRYDQAGARTHWADRDPGDVLWSGGLLDTGALLNEPFTPTVGYWPTGDPYPERDIDHIRVTRDLATAVRAVRVHRTELALTASDHLPKVAELDLAAVVSP